MWFLTDLARLERERGAVEALEETASWLQGVNWRIDQGGIVMECDIRLATGDSYRLRTTFPEHYPSAPASVRPQDPTILSSHQYGRGGELCLEVGPDNWHRDLHTTADLLRSAHRLLRDEAARRDDDAVVIPSRHAVTQGQEQRGKFARFVLTPSAKAALGNLDDVWVVAHFTVVYHEEAWTIFLAKLERAGSDDWTCEQLPASLKRFGRSAKGLVRGGSLSALGSAVFSTAELLTAHLKSLSIPNTKEDSEPPAIDRIEYVLTHRAGSTWQLVMRWDDGTKILACSTLEADAAQPIERLGPEAEVLVEKSVGIVGLGSVGSKLAVTLARAGVGQFCLIDDDLLHPSNLVRHDSDWVHVGQHKVDAVADRIAVVSPSTTVLRHRVRLVGQESAATTAATTTALGQCDVIIDATANPDVFNLLAHVARQSNRPMVWVEVFGGGFGGLVARARPQRDAEPFTLRQAISDAANRIAAEKDVDTPAVAGDYEASPGDEPRMIAGDAAVAIMAHLAAEYILDTLSSREPSRFPYPGYYVGLHRAWIFDEPLQVYPVEADTLGSWSSEVSENDPERQAGLAFVKDLVNELPDRAEG